MEILRVPPYDDIVVNFVVPSGYEDADIYARVTDMADLSVQTLEFLEWSTGDNINISLPGRYDNNYRVEIFTVGEGEELIHEEYYELIRPYVNPNTLGTTASEIAEYKILELVARSMIDTFCPEGFYNKKITVVGTGNGSDYFSLWEKVYRVFKVYENNVLVYDRSNPELGDYQYTITPDKTAIQRVSADVLELNRYESTAQNLPVASGDLGYYGYEGISFPSGYDYTFVVDHGYLNVPEDVEYAAKLLIEDLKCGKLDYYKRYVTSYNTDQFKIQFDKAMLGGTGNFLVDKILDKYVKTIVKPGII
ncbi:MAG: hypothetical protein AN484_01280 [Aphanizomenon flos-aquae WA102]|jgi:hypothetical protein|uniref:Uncharacterized protein n=1 Tax=Aphanizomenon flos-aquae WA102 TaxID=1710896 RepID=A0A1B7X8G8_APHFL|nr:MAG: hypothetical protein AN484_01280 [Aphanizomenon flos-aquae WA102]